GDRRVGGRHPSFIPPRAARATTLWSNPFPCSNVRSRHPPAHALSRASSARCGMSTMVRAERVQVVVIGAGQAGLSVGYHLPPRGIQFVILEAKERIGDSWRERWDSLRLLTPGSLDGLDGMPFPTPGH